MYRLLPLEKGMTEKNNESKAVGVVTLQNWFGS